MEGTILATSALNQFGMDFQGNSRRIIESIVQAKRVHNAKIRLGSQSEVPGFSVEDHFLEPDTVLHSWQVLVQVLEVTLIPPYNDILCVIGMPVHFRGVIYSAGVVIYAGQIVLIRPKNILCNDEISREKRWFTSWNGGKKLMEFTLPECVIKTTGQKTTVFGNAFIQTDDNFLIGMESLDEAKNPEPTSTEMYLMGANIVMNVGGAAFQLGNGSIFDYITSSTAKTGGIYMYSGPCGFDGSRNYFEGQSSIICNGKCIVSTDMFSLKEVDLAVAAMDLSEVDIFRTSIASRSLQAASYITKSLKSVKVPGFSLKILIPHLSPPIPFPKYSREQQIINVPACYLWDYLKRSSAVGFFIPISGGLDSISVLAIVSNMCKLVLKTLPKLTGYNFKIMEDTLVRIFGKVPADYVEMMKKVVYTAFLSMRFSLEETKARSCKVANELGASHLQGSIDEIYDAYIETFAEFTNSDLPKFQSQGGSIEENIALKSLQSRIRMVVTYISGQLLPFAFNRQGFLIVLSSTSLEKNVFGYHTKYGNSSGDINPIGCISKLDLKCMLKSLVNEYPSLQEVIDAETFTELSPDQINIEADMEVTFDDIRQMAIYWKEFRYGPFTMFLHCCEIWKCEKAEVARKVKRFFVMYSQNRHKMTVITPSLHMDVSGVEDNRFDLRQFLFNLNWTAQFDEIDQALSEMEKL